MRTYIGPFILCKKRTHTVQAIDCMECKCYNGYHIDSSDEDFSTTSFCPKCGHKLVEVMCNETHDIEVSNVVGVTPSYLTKVITHHGCNRDTYVPTDNCFNSLWLTRKKWFKSSQSEILVSIGEINPSGEIEVMKSCLNDSVQKLLAVYENVCYSWGVIGVV